MLVTLADGSGKKCACLAWCRIFTLHFHSVIQQQYACTTQTCSSGLAVLFGANPSATTNIRTLYNSGVAQFECKQSIYCDHMSFIRAPVQSAVPCIQGRSVLILQSQHIKIFLHLTPLSVKCLSIEKHVIGQCLCFRAEV